LPVIDAPSNADVDAVPNPTNAATVNALAVDAPDVVPSEVVDEDNAASDSCPEDCFPLPKTKGWPKKKLQKLSDQLLQHHHLLELQDLLECQLKAQVLENILLHWMLQMQLPMQGKLPLKNIDNAGEANAQANANPNDSATPYDRLSKSDY
jgi:hypothetical protein